MDHHAYDSWLVAQLLFRRGFDPANFVAEFLGLFVFLMGDGVLHFPPQPDQVGVPLRVFVVDLSMGRDPASLLVMVNPEFVSREGLQLEEEGCLSVPGFNATVARPLQAVVKGLNRDGHEQVHEGKELLARAFQHEMDHLDGKLFIDHLRGIKREMIVRRIRKLTRAGKW